MKHTKYIRIALLLLCALLAVALIGCGDTPPAPENCTHDFQPGDYVVHPICGETTEGIRAYVCSLCGTSEERTVTNTQQRHELEPIVTKEPTCTEKGVRAMTCKHCGFSRDTDISSLGGHVYDPSSFVVDYDANTRTTFCERCEEQVQMKAYVTYEEFGAVADGRTNDAECMRKAHDYANKNGLEVWATAGAKYYIGELHKAIDIMTNVNWLDAIIIIDDTVVRWDDAAARGVNIFRVCSDSDVRTLTVPEGMTLTKGQTNIGMTFKEPCMLYIENSNEKIYLRYGINENDGVSQQEVILVDKDGNVDPSTPIQYDYTAVTAIRAYSVTDTPITIKGGTLRTMTCNPTTYDPDYENEYYYYARGLRVERSNTTIDGVNHEKRGEHHIENDYNYQAKGVPYAGIFNFQYCYNATFKNSNIVGHRAYSFFNESGSRNEMGSYELNGTACINLNLINLRQTNDITDRVFNHGAMGSNFCRNVLMDGCYIDRFDAHQGLHNATIKNSTLGFGILIIGGGTVTIENVERLSGNDFVSLREDYNSVFNGDIIIKNCIAGASISRIVKGNWVKDHYNGLPNWCVRNITIDGLTLKNNGTVYLFNITGLQANATTYEPNPFYLPESISIKGVEGGSLVISYSTLYNSVPTTRK